MSLVAIKSVNGSSYSLGDVALLVVFEQYWASKNYIYQVSIEWTRPNIDDNMLYSLNDGSLPPWEVLLPLGNATVNGTTRGSLLIVPKQQPQLLQQYVHVGRGDGEWELFKSVNLTSPFFTVWKKIVPNGDIGEITKIYLFSIDLIVEVDFPDLSHPFVLNFTTSINGLKTRMTQITGVTLVPQFNYMFLGRSSDDFTKPGEAVMLSMADPHVFFVTVTYTDIAPQNFFSWINSFSIGLYWTSQTGASDLIIYRWDLYGNFLTNATLHIDDGTKNPCYTWTSAVGVQVNGDYALLTAKPCDEDSVIMSQLHVTQLSGEMAFTEWCYGDTSAAQYGITLPNVDPAGVVIATHESLLNRLELVSFGEDNLHAAHSLVCLN